jgi:hypothetical protein
MGRAGAWASLWAGLYPGKPLCEFQFTEGPIGTATKRSITQRFMSLNVTSLNVRVSKRESFKT